MRITKQRRIEIADLAEAVAETHCPQGAVDPLRIAGNKRITHCFGHYGNAFDGLLEWDRGRFHVYCNLDRVSAPDSPRARFTLAHEMGHFFLDEHRWALEEGRAPSHPSVCQYESRDRIEQEADRFASSLLMPAERFCERASFAAKGLNGIRSLAEQFGTSVTATALRYAELDLSPCTVIKWNWRGKAWKKSASKAFAERMARPVRHPAFLTKDSATWRLLNGEIVTDENKPYLECGTTAAVWFRNIRDGEPDDQILIEQALPLGRYGILTFLFPA